MISLRCGLQRHFSKIREIDTANNADFKAANDMFNTMLIKLKQVGMGVTVHKPEITSEDIGKLYNCFDLNTYTELQNKVFLDCMLFFCNRGRENLRELKRDDFKFEGTGENRYVELRDHLTKNQR
jgi:hypothetical protein